MFWKLIGRIGRAFLSLRYKVEIRGLENLTPERLSREGGILFLPNHTAHIDPLVLFTYLWPTYRMRPLVIEYIYRMRLLKPAMRFVKALPIPNFDLSINQLKLKQAERAIAEISAGLKARENFILYPSGRLKTSGKEVLAGASGTHAVLQECPEANVVLVRTTGLWGSTFSRAIEGQSPDLNKVLWNGVKVIFRNFLFFCPRRKIVIEIEVASDLPRNATRIDFNRTLENWYNQYPTEDGTRLQEEPLKLVSYAFWRKKLLTPFQGNKEKTGFTGAKISDEVRNAVVAEIRRIVNNPNLEVRDEMTLAVDLGMDSLNIAELLAFLSQKFGLPEVHPEGLDSVQNAMEIAAGSSAAGKPRHAILHEGWPEERETRPDPVPPMGKTIPAAFLNSCERMDFYAACGDDLVGVLSYKNIKRSALVLALYFKTLPSKHIGVLLPASVGSYLTILALQLAGKVPVMLNWTLGPRYLDDMMRVSGAEVVISSWRFLDRLSHVDFGRLADSMILLEDIRDQLSLKTKIRGALLSMRKSKSIQRTLGLMSIDENAPAVILFTSGTEASPKGVPLSHKNIISNLRGGMHCIDLDAEDVVYGILPPFHSFGFSVAGLFAILTGMRIAFYPDPTDSFALAEGIERWKITVFCSAPSFLRGVFQAAKPHQLDSVRYFVTGAEKTPAEFYEKVKALGTGASLVEGYGITECSPILTINRPHLGTQGVGHPLPDVEMMMIHPETKVPLRMGEEGEICVRGPSIFRGYLGETKSPFITIHGKQWYRTGDLGKLEDGSLVLSGRLKRFTKIGGEMISLGAIEEAVSLELIKRGTISSDVPSLALISDERDSGKSRLVLFLRGDATQEEINDLLQSSGFSRLIKISDVRKIEEIPLMGTGKTDYRRLQGMLE
jgi:long-chain-fatty-acid--[acyl-carrier-protein] ligase